MNVYIYVCVCVCIFFFFFFFCATSVSYESSQPGGQIRAVAASLHYSHSNMVFEPCLQTASQLMAPLELKPTEKKQGSNPHPCGH